MESQEEVDERAQAILAFWFGDPGRAASPEAWLDDRTALWFGGGSEADAACRASLAPFMEPAAGGALASWEAAPRSALALVLLLDQAPRAVHRGTARAFATDGRALATAERALSAGHDRRLGPFERAFLYLPYEHAEDRAAQARSVKLYQGLLDAAPAEHRDVFASYLDYAERHRDVIERFGRFPHRNAALGRASTPAERTYLAEPGSGF